MELQVFDTTWDWGCTRISTKSAQSLGGHCEHWGTVAPAICPETAFIYKALSGAEEKGWLTAPQEGLERLWYSAEVVRVLRPMAVVVRMLRPMLVVVRLLRLPMLVVQAAPASRPLPAARPRRFQALSRSRPVGVGAL